MGYGVAVGKEDAVFVVAAHAGSIEGHGEIEDGRGGGTFGDEIASEN